MKYELAKAPGSFGDKEVLLHYFTPEKGGLGPAVLILHGVHGRACPGEGNKYGFLAGELASNGYDVCIAESSRLRRDKESFDDRSEWAFAAFRGKTFAMELFDACSALRSFREKYPGSRAVLWGFSLGGIIGALIAGKKAAEIVSRAGLQAPADIGPGGLVVSGSGDELRPEAELSLRLPVLDSLCHRSELHEAASRAYLDFALFFYGTLDESFSEASSRRIFDRLPLDAGRKEFCIIDGADHPFRNKNGAPSAAPLMAMLAKTTETLGRY
ncbi:MAG: alpha/beta hydrolase [Aminivibrio sp.]|jgi:pimeloyl-ACP methyl ester carboxylesterase